MHKFDRGAIVRCLSPFLLLLSAASLFAQCDMSGEWVMNSREDWEDRFLSGAPLGDYTGYPINAAGRQFADSWNGSIESQSQRQAAPHTATYASRGPNGTRLRFAVVENPATRVPVAYTVVGIYGILNRTIWLDGRPHPPEFAEHTYEGFSTGECQRGILKVTTTHIKYGELRRNGVPSSADAKMTEYFIRHGDLMTIFEFVEDPAYYDEPVVKTTDLVRDPSRHAAVWEPVQVSSEELGTGSTDPVPSYPLGTIHSEYATKFGLPLEAVRGGKETLYPEYFWKLRQMSGENSAPRLGGGK